MFKFQSTPWSPLWSNHQCSQYIFIYFPYGWFKYSMILPTYPGKIPQTSPDPHKERNSFINCWWNVWGILQWCVDEILEISTLPIRCFCSFIRFVSEVFIAHTFLYSRLVSLVSEIPLPFLDTMTFGGLKITPLKFNIAPENRPSQKEIHVPTIIFQGLS